MSHRFLHGLVEWTGHAVKCIVAQPEVDDPGLHPYAFVLNHLKSLDLLVGFDGMAFHIVFSLSWSDGTPISGTSCHGYGNKGARMRIQWLQAGIQTRGGSIHEGYACLAFPCNTLLF